MRRHLTIDTLVRFLAKRLSILFSQIAIFCPEWTVSKEPEQTHCFSIHLVVVGLLVFSTDICRAGPTELEQARSLAQIDLETIGQMRFRTVSPNHLRMFGGSKGSDIVEFFNSRVRSIVWKDNPTAFASGFDGKMFVGREFLKLTRQSFRLAALVHEARHSEGHDANTEDYWPHRNCSSPSFFEAFDFKIRLPRLDGMTFACDESDEGAYAVTYVFLRSIAEACGNCSEELKNQARVDSATQALSSIINPKAAERLIQNSNRNPREAFNEHKIVLKNWAKSNLKGSDWLEICISNRSCFVDTDQ